MFEELRRQVDDITGKFAEIHPETRKAGTEEIDPIEAYIRSWVLRADLAKLRECVERFYRFLGAEAGRACLEHFVMVRDRDANRHGAAGGDCYCHGLNGRLSDEHN